MKVIYKDGTEFNCFRAEKVGDYYICNNGKRVIPANDVDHVEVVFATK